MARFEVKFIVKRDDGTYVQETYYPIIEAIDCELAAKHFLYKASATKLAGFSIQEVDVKEFDT